MTDQTIGQVINKFSKQVLEELKEAIRKENHITFLPTDAKFIELGRKTKPKRKWNQKRIK